MGAVGKIDHANTEVAGKTGTTTLNYSTIVSNGLKDTVANDSWACLYSKEYSIAIWMGYDRVYKDHYIQTAEEASYIRKILAAKFSKVFFQTNSKLITSN